MSRHRSAHFVKLYNSHEVDRFVILCMSLSFRETLLTV